MLPEECISMILSFTSPLDACRSSLVSSPFRSAAESDTVWERFLPADYRDILMRSVVPLKFSSKKQLFFCLCEPILIDGGRKSFKIERSSGKKSYMLSARELAITWSDVPLHWSWISVAKSRFAEVAVLRVTCWLEITGKISTKMLSPYTSYGAYLIIKIADRAYGLDARPSQVSVQVGSRASANVAYLHHPSRKKLPGSQDDNDMIELPDRFGEVPMEREDGWMEIKLGEFFTGEVEEEVLLSLTETEGYQLKGGLVINGIELRPLNVSKNI